VKRFCAVFLALISPALAQQPGYAERPEVRAVLVCDDGRLVGVITRKTLVREVVAAGRDPRRRQTPVAPARHRG